MNSNALPNQTPLQPIGNDPLVTGGVARALGQVASVLYRAYFGALRWLPGRPANWLSFAVYAQLYRLVQRRRTRNLRRALAGPDWTPARVREFHRGHLRYQARHAVDVARLRVLSPSGLQSQVSLVGEEHLRSALRGGRGVLLVGGHLGNWFYVTTRLGAAGYRLSNVANRVPVPGLETDLNTLRNRFGIRTTPLGGGGSQAAAAAFACNEIFCAWIDVALRERHRVEVPFGRARLAVDIGPARLALAHAVPVLLATSHYADDGTAHVTLRPMPARPEHCEWTPAHLTGLWAQELFREVASHPEQWWCWSTVTLGEGPCESLRAPFEIHAQSLRA